MEDCWSPELIAYVDREIEKLKKSELKRIEQMSAEDFEKKLYFKLWKLRRGTKEK